MGQILITFFSGFFNSLLSKRDVELGWALVTERGELKPIPYLAFKLLERFKTNFYPSLWKEVEPYPQTRVFEVNDINFAFCTLLLFWYEEANYKNLHTLYKDLGIPAHIDKRTLWFNEFVYTPVAIFLVNQVIQNTEAQGLSAKIDEYVMIFYEEHNGLLQIDPNATLPTTTSNEPELNGKFSVYIVIALVVVFFFFRKK